MDPAQQQPLPGPGPDESSGLRALATEDLVMAMPRRELYGISGFTTDISMDIIECIADESWFASSRHLREDIESKEVRLALLIRQDDQWLVTEQGVLMHVTAIPPQVAELGTGLRSLREFSRLAAKTLVGEARFSSQLYGYLNDDSLPETRPYFLLVYLVQCQEVISIPSSMSMVRRLHLASLPLDPVSTLVVDGLPER